MYLLTNVVIPSIVGLRYVPYITLQNICLLFPLAWVDPGLICSILTRARSILLMMSSTVALQMNRLGFLFSACINASIACFRRCLRCIDFHKVSQAGGPK